MSAITLLFSPKGLCFRVLKVLHLDRLAACISQELYYLQGTDYFSRSTGLCYFCEWMLTAFSSLQDLLICFQAAEIETRVDYYSPPPLDPNGLELVNFVPAMWEANPVADDLDKQAVVSPGDFLAWLQ
ncbi:unnamed protein product [Dovyalis caffra]|uniref:Uncharacterized protein n=1 Tax=Dovyalis caffra TaxID=77055 RepID=A0AAV1SGR9_9ROSI|nr:unnamed protein product [Dovyalis caffra]